MGVGIKNYHEDKKQHWISSDSRRAHFLGRNAVDTLWSKSSSDDNQKHSKFKLEIKMPDYSKEDILVTIKNDILIVRAEKKKIENPPQYYVIKEIEFDLLERKFKLEKNICKEKIEAIYKDNVLMLIFSGERVTQSEGIREIKVN